MPSSERGSYSGKEKRFSKHLAPVENRDGNWFCGADNQFSMLRKLFMRRRS
jgi:hypothetical protein